MQFYLHRDGVQFSSRGNFDGIGVEKHPIMTVFFSYPGLLFVAVYHRCVHTRVWWSWWYTMNFAMSIWANAIRPYIYPPIYPYGRIAYAKLWETTLSSCDRLFLKSTLTDSLISPPRETNNRFWHKQEISNLAEVRKLLFVVALQVYFALPSLQGFCFFSVYLVMVFNQI